MQLWLQASIHFEELNPCGSSFNKVLVRVELKAKASLAAGLTTDYAIRKKDRVTEDVSNHCEVEKMTLN